jgi:hypothetical protein
MKYFVLLGLFALITQSAGAAETSLAGQWRFALDPTDAGVTARWFEQKLEHSITLTGILQAQGYGNEIDTKSFHPQSVTLQAAVTATHLRLTALAGFGIDRSAALADFAIHYTGPPLPGTQLPSPTYQRARSSSTDVEEGKRFLGRTFSPQSSGGMRFLERCPRLE